MNPNDRLQNIASFVQNHLADTFQKRSDQERLRRLLLHADYRWQHTLRVAQYGKIIAESEGVDVEQIIVTCLLHDVAWFDTNPETNREHGRIGSNISRPILKDNGYRQEQIEAICYSIASHVDEENPKSIEAKILSDADDIDRFGPYRILQWCYSDAGDYFSLAEKLREHIGRLERYRDENSLFTSTGKQLFSEQLDLQITFFCQFVGEKDLSIMPNL